jgi:hypothetical protein
MICGLGRHNGADGRANLVHGAAGGFRDTGKVFVDGLRSGGLGGVFRGGFFWVAFGEAFFAAVFFFWAPRPFAVEVRLTGLAFFIGR